MELAKEIVEDYYRIEAKKRVVGGEPTKQLVPWFILTKGEGDQLNIDSFQTVES